MAKVIDVSEVPVLVTITNNTESAVVLPIYPNDQELTLQVGEHMDFPCDTSREYLFYYLEAEQLGLTLVASPIEE